MQGLRSSLHGPVTKPGSVAKHRMITRGGPFRGPGRGFRTGSCLPWF